MNHYDTLGPEAIRILAEEDTRVALGKAEKKKLERDGTITKRLKDNDVVTINPDKPDMLGQGIR